MRYMLLMHYPERDTRDLETETISTAEAAFATYAATLEAAGALIAGEVLRSSESSTTVTSREGEFRIQDGPFADTKEQLAGVFLIEAADLDAALAWARLAPGVHWGSIEIRPVATHTVAGVWIS